MTVLHRMHAALAPLWREKRCRSCAVPFVPQDALSPGESSVVPASPSPPLLGEVLPPPPGSVPARVRAVAARSLPALFLPGRAGAEASFCPDCAARLARRVQGFCPRCGEPAAWAALPAALCGRCLREPPPWEAFVFHGVYEGLLRSLLLRLKFGQDSVLGHALGSLLAGHPDLEGLGVDCVVPVPLHAVRLAERGYNQALELARPVAGRLGAPLLPGLLRRTRATRSQPGLSREDRAHNLRGAFVAASGAAGRHILLVDDAVTSGATLAAAARILREAGAARVCAAALGRTALHGRSRQRF